MKIFGIPIPFTRRSATAPIPHDRYFAVGPWGYLDSSRISPDTAIRFTAVLSAVKVISETLAALPVMVYRRRPDGGKDRATKHPLYKLLRQRPNSLKTSSFEFREMLTAHVLLWGNGYAQILRNSLDEPVELRPMHPSRVTPKVENERLVYVLRMPDGGEQKLSAEQVLHIRGYRDSGNEGLSVVAAAEKAIRAGLSLEDFGMNFFEGGAFPSGVLEYEQGTMSQQAKDNLRESWQKIHGGANRGKQIAVLEAGLKWKQMMIPQTDAQFLEQRKFQISEIARIFRVPPHMLADLDRATFSNIEQQSLEFITYTMLPWFRRWEEALGRDLIDADEADDVFVEFIPDALLRGDTLTRATAYRTQIECGILSRNEARLMENRNPYDGGDEFLTPLNMAGPNGQKDDAQGEPEEEREEEREEEAQAPEPQKGPRVTDDAVKAAFRGLFRATWEKIARKEVNAVKAAARKKSADEFGDWRAEFLDELHDFAKTCLREPLHSYAFIRGDADATEALVRHTQAYREEVCAAVQECFDNPAAGYTRSADKVAAYWTERLLGYSGEEYGTTA
jgi:HK97 family phage portal protein